MHGSWHDWYVFPGFATVSLSLGPKSMPFGTPGILQWPFPGDESPGYFLTPFQGYGLSRKKREGRGTPMSQSVIVFETPIGATGGHPEARHDNPAEHEHFLWRISYSLFAGASRSFCRPGPRTGPRTRRPLRRIRWSSVPVRPRIPWSPARQTAPGPVNVSV